jgi:hypothetical protein
LVESQKNKIVTRCSFSALFPKQILEALFASPRRRKKRRHRQETTEKNQTSPKNADRRQDQKPIATKPMHGRIIPVIRDFEISFSGMSPPSNHKVVKALDPLNVKTVDLDVKWLGNHTYLWLSNIIRARLGRFAPGKC